MEYTWMWTATFIGVIFILTILLITTHKKLKIIVLRCFKKYHIMRFITTVFIPVLIPYVVSIIPIMESSTPDWIRTTAYVSCIIMTINSIFQFRYWKKELTETYLRWENAASSYAFNNLYKIHKNKNWQLQQKSINTNNGLVIEQNQIPYDVNAQIQKICSEYSNTIATITGISSVRMAVSFIYQVSSSNNSNNANTWQWIIGRNSKFRTTLQDFIDREGSVYHHLIHDNVPFLFYNDKKRAQADGIYYYSAKDKLYPESGSFLASKFAFSNNKENCCEGIIMVTSYGEKFVKETSEFSEQNFEKLILDKIFPCYKNLLQIELGMLYFSHKVTNGTPAME